MSEIDLITRRYLDSINYYNEQKKILQDSAIKAEMRRMYKKMMILHGMIFISEAVAIFAIIWWYRL